MTSTAIEMRPTNNTAATRTVKTLAIGDELTGTCRRWIARDGCSYGFVRVTGVAEELFVSARELQNIDVLRVGDRVRFEVRLGRDGRLYAADAWLVTAR